MKRGFHALFANRVRTWRIKLQMDILRGTQYTHIYVMPLIHSTWASTAHENRIAKLYCKIKGFEGQMSLLVMVTVRTACNLFYCNANRFLPRKVTKLVYVPRNIWNKTWNQLKTLTFRVPWKTFLINFWRCKETAKFANNDIAQRAISSLLQSTKLPDKQW